MLITKNNQLKNIFPRFTTQAASEVRPELATQLGTFVLMILGLQALRLMIEEAMPSCIMNGSRQYVGGLLSQ